MAVAISLYAATVLDLEMEYHYHYHDIQGRDLKNDIMESIYSIDKSVLEIRYEERSKQAAVEERRLLRRISDAYHSLGAALLNYRTSTSSLTDSKSNWEKAHRVWLLGDRRQRRRLRALRECQGHREVVTENKNNQYDRSESTESLPLIGDADDALVSEVCKVKTYDYDRILLSKNYVQREKDNFRVTGIVLTSRNIDVVTCPEVVSATVSLTSITDSTASVPCYKVSMPHPGDTLCPPLQQSGNQCVYLSKDALVSSEECSRAIQWAEEHAAHAQSLSSAPSGWSTSRHYAVPTTDIPIHEMPPFLDWFNTLMKNKLGPMVRDQFLRGQGRVVVHDAFIVKYQHIPTLLPAEVPPPTLSTETGTSHSRSTGTSHSRSLSKCLKESVTSSQRHLPLHTDESTHSLIIALNRLDEYEGGGTYFAALDAALRPGQE